MRRLACLLALVALPMALGAAACAESGAGQGVGSADDSAGADGSDEGEGAAAGQDLSVVASVYPLAWVAEQLAPGAEVVVLTDAGDEPHDIDLTPRARQSIETADVVAYMGDIGYQPQVENAVGDRSGPAVSFADVVGPDALSGRGAGHDEDGHDHADHDDDGHDHDDGHDDEVDPHAWFHPGLMAEMTEALGAALASADPAGADAYEAGAEALASDFRDLHREIGDLFADGCAHDQVIVSHEAYAYLLEPHGLHQEGISGSGGHGPASPQRIADLVRLVRAEGIEHVLAEPVEGREDARAVAAEAGAEVLDIHSLEVIDEEGLADQGFLELLREQARTVARAMDCD